MTVSELIEKLKYSPEDYDIQFQLSAYHLGDVEPENLPFNSVFISHDEKLVLIFDDLSLYD